MFPSYLECLNTVEENRLESEFRQFLRIIREDIKDISSNHSLSHYRAWIEKLSHITNNKITRNEYLFELAKQIKAKVLLPPFSILPPVGSLDSFHIDFDHYQCQDMEDDYNWSTDFVCDIPSCMCHSHNPSQETILQEMSIFPFENYCYGTYPYFDQTDAVEHSKEEGEVSNDKNRLDELKSPSTGQPDNRVPQEVTMINKEVELEQANTPPDEIFEDSSWCDMTDSSVTSMANPLGSGDAEPKPRPKMDKYLEHQSQLKSAYPGNQQLIYRVQDIKADNKQDSYEETNSLNQNIDFKAADWKRAIEFLHLKLTETHNHNTELKIVIESLRCRIRDEVSKREMAERQQIRLHESRKKEMETVKLFQRGHIEKIEKLFKINLEESEKAFNQRVVEIKQNYEQKIAELKTEHEKNITEKDKHISQLTGVIEKNCSRLSHEVAALRKQVENYINSSGENKIIILQKCVSKMDKLFHKSEKEYLKQIDKLRQELDLKDKMTLIQLKTLKAELITECSSEKQKQFNEIVDNLEVKYIQMLEYHENEVLENKKQDDEKMDYLKDLLDRHDIPYDT